MMMKPTCKHCATACVCLIPLLECSLILIHRFVGFVDVVDLVAFCIKGMNRGIASAKLFSETVPKFPSDLRERDVWVSLGIVAVG